MTRLEGDSRAASRVVPAIPDKFTDCMEQLQQGYLAAVAAAAGCTVEFTQRDQYGVDALIIRQVDQDREEVSVKAALKNTTKIKPDPTKPEFSYQFRVRRHLERLTLPRTGPKMILLVMATPPEQALWTACDHESLTVRHCCYWKYLEGDSITAGVRYPSIQISTANVFDSVALTKIMDKLDRGESLR